ncbi:CAF1 family ribonuclease [Musa troglodytarum]|uniref:poly(A)-specific ribonuclease n=1 Tax=Musa troglodytarum TaxID=320322 RepID=A0A9E7JJS6_9LILI|nr:CAF1 family ribonuclease [Musa troglodytarum]
MPSQRGGPPYLVVRRVWAWNLEYEFSIIASLVDRFSYVAFDTEFPGFLYSTGRPHRLLPPSLRYALLKANVDEMELVQLGLTLFDAFGDLPDIGTGGRVGFVWEFNFREFDVRRDPQAPDSIDLLRSSGIDFDRLPLDGIDSGHFAALLYRSGLVAHCRFCRPLSARWIAFHGCYDFAYLIKVLGNGRPLPDTLEEFLGLTVDLKYMMRGCKGLSGGLESVASTLGVPRQAGKSHQAGSDSLVTYQVYLKMKQRFFNDRDAKVAWHRGIIYGLQAC